MLNCNYITELYSKINTCSEESMSRFIISIIETHYIYSKN